MTKATRCCHQDEMFCQGVTYTQFVILDHIARQGVLKLTDLHGLLAVEKSTSTRLIQPLVEQGLVLKNASPTDSRAINLKLSDKGIGVHKEFWSCLKGFLDKVANEIPADIREDVINHVIMFNQAIMNVFNKDNCCTR
jgi:DNA-binding MarR family transcriptional regulator